MSQLELSNKALPNVADINLSKPYSAKTRRRDYRNDCLKSVSI